MVDTRFHRFAGPATVGAVLAATGWSEKVGDLPDPGFRIEGVAELELAGPGDLALAAHLTYIDELRSTAAGLVIIAPGLGDAVPSHSRAIVVDRPHQLFVDILDFLYPAST
ncbi:MAG TPA: LpxD N-terminal domain-containing protein, partial [Devosia sp.]|nr:LpxD N-terminal domain-containing protein [Devosia sp.]